MDKMNQLGLNPKSTIFGQGFGLRFGAALVLILGAAAMRLIPHPPNFTPIAAIALFGAAAFPRREMGLVLALTALFLSDCVLGFHHQMIAVYTAFIVIAFIGLVLCERRTATKVAGAALTSSVVFFVITNTAVWFSSPEYPKTWQGLMLCWTAGLPFFGNTIAGDLVSTGVLFGAWAWVEKTLPQPKLA